MKCLAQRSSSEGTPTAACRGPAHAVMLGSIPGLERLLPGRFVPGDTVRSRYGSWTLPRSFKGRRITLIVNGMMFG